MPIGTADCELVGCMSKDRYLAAVFDEFLALIVALIAASKMSIHGTAASWVGLVAAYFAYFFLSEVLFRNTFGKWFCGLRVCTLLGQRCTRMQMVIRSIFRIVEVNPAVFGFLPAAMSIYLTPKRQRIGDLVAGTIVVRRISRRPTNGS